MGKLMVGLARVLPLCAVPLVLPALVASQPAPHTVRRVWTQDAGGNEKMTFAPGDTI